EIAHSLLNFHTQENQLGIYTGLFTDLPDEYKKMRQLPDPKELIKAPADVILNFNQSLVKDLSIIADLIKFLDLPPAGYPASCSAEEGTPSPAGDQGGGSCSPTNLFAKHRFPLKWRATCVKNQGNRGTC